MRVLVGSILLGVLILGCNATKEEDAVSPVKKGKLFPVIQLVRFPNDACVAGTRNGTCYTAEECTERSGSSGGSCAGGYGVCCIFERGCGMSSNENCTYFTSSTLASTDNDCQLEICPCNNNICQLRLDFTTFVITGPTTDQTTTAKIEFGIPSGSDEPAMGVDAEPIPKATITGTCLTDTFTVTTPGGVPVNPFCGTNTGQHIYVDAGTANECNALSFSLLGTAVGTTLANRAWDIKVTQYDCNYDNLAPQGCLQYYFGTNTDSVQTFNYDGNLHLARQDQNICVRREVNNCRICWFAEDPLDVTLSGMQEDKGVASPNCCGYGRSGRKVQGFDCLFIPGAENQANGAVLNFQRFCGRSKGLVTASGGMPTTICSSSPPFNIRFLSDPYEFMLESGFANKGARLTYFQDSMNC